jgi:ABC-type nitrate/sulfonate/bicarbonate transport system substrate-binding protein
LSRRYIAALAVIAVACVLAVRLWPRRDATLVRVAYPPIMASLPLFIAEEGHLFDQARLQVKTVSFSSSNDLVNALVAGEADVLPAVALVPLVHLEIQHPGKFRVFSHSRMRPGNSLYRITVKENSPVRGVQELRGKKLGVFPGTSATKLLSAFFKKQGVDPQEITFVQLPPSAQLSSLESGAVDAVFAYEPLAATLPDRYRSVYTSVYADLVDPCPLGVSVIARDFERHHPELAKRTTSVFLKGIALMASKPAEAQALLPKFTKMAPETAARVNVADITLTDTVDTPNLQRFIDLLYDIGEIPEKIDAHRLVAPTK